MEYSDIRGIATLFALIAFLGAVFWAYGRGRKQSFSEAANQLFNEDEEQLHLKSLKEADKK